MLILIRLILKTHVNPQEEQSPKFTNVQEMKQSGLRQPKERTVKPLLVHAQSQPDLSTTVH